MSDTEPASPVRAAITLATWGAAWQAGCSADHLLDALGEVGLRGAVHPGTPTVLERTGLPDPGERLADGLDMLALLRRGGPPALVLPVPGDVRGVPAGSAVVGMALDAGAAVVLPAIRVGVLPLQGRWCAFEWGQAHAALPLREARHLLDDAARTAARALSDAEPTLRHRDARHAVRQATRAETAELPPGTPAAAEDLLQRATSLAAFLSVVSGDELGAATSRELAHLRGILAPLHGIVREARRSAVATTVTALRAAGQVLVMPE